MPRHCWGDDWEYWHELNKAINYFTNLYYKCTKKWPHTKEKYGTMRFEFTFLWIENAEHCRLFRECVRRTIKRFPCVAAEICHDAGHVLNDKYFEGWCAGVTYQACGSYWSSKKRPKGV